MECTGASVFSPIIIVYDSHERKQGALAAAIKTTGAIVVVVGVNQTDRPASPSGCESPRCGNPRPRTSTRTWDELRSRGRSAARVRGAPGGCGARGGALRTAP